MNAIDKMPFSSLAFEKPAVSKARCLELVDIGPDLWNRASLEREPKNQFASSERAAARTKSQDATGGIADDAAIAIDPKYEFAYRERGRAKYRNRGRECRACARRDGYDRVAVARRHEYDVADYAGSLADESAVLRSDPKSAYAYRIRGLARYYIVNAGGASNYAGTVADETAGVRLA